MSQAKSMQYQVGIPTWLQDLDRNAGPRYLQIAEALERAIFEGQLKPGDRLPPQREVAALLKLDLTTITRAYDEAKRRNLLEGRGARGTYVSMPKLELGLVLDLSMNTPPPPAGVDFPDLLKQGLKQLVLRSDNELLMTYHQGGGSEVDRTAGALWLEPMFGKIDPEHIVVCPGAQGALAALILANSAPGDVILAEPTVYPGLRSAAMHLGRQVIAVETDHAGMMPDALAKACARHKARLIYLNPTLQNPTTATMPAKRRKEIAAVAVRSGARIIEDDPYWRFADSPPPPVTTYARDHSYYVSTLSKCLTPGLRVAYVVLRDAAERQRFISALRSFVLVSAPLSTALSTQWILDGSAQQLFEGVKKEAEARHELALEVLAGRPGTTGRGLHIWLPLPGYWTSSDLARTAVANGLAVSPSEVFSGSANGPNAIRISLGGVQDRKRLGAGLRRLSQLLACAPRSIHDSVI